MLAYIGPGAGVAVLSSLLVVFAALLAGFLGVLTWPVRSLIRLIRLSRRESSPKARRVVVLGMDGLDPARLQRYMDAGKLPNASRLAREGTFRELGTTFPAVSPVAWATFQTGVNPAKHRIFDFLRRDPSSYAILPADTELVSGHGANRLKTRRRSQPFWKILGEYGIFSLALNIPVTFPPEKFFGVCLAGLGVPDLLGSQGTFFYYTTEEPSPEEAQPTGGRRITVQQRDGRVMAALPGPPLGRDGAPLSLEFAVDLKCDPPVLRIGGERADLPPGKTTGWIRVKFRAGWATRLRGMCRFRLVSVRPHFRLYVSPIHLDPQWPPMPISHPRLYSTYLAKLLGDFPTLGFAEDTWAFDQGIADEAAFLEECYEFHEQRAGLFYHSLKQCRQGMLAFVFDVPDRIQHMFMAQEDRAKPGDEPSEIEKLYVRMDEHIGRLIGEADEGTVFFVISDHGYKRFRRCFHVNGWLREHGYLSLKDGRTSGGRYFEHVDWSGTRAYSMGFGAVFLNLAGREGGGIVDPQDAAALKVQLQRELEAVVDPQTGARPIAKVYEASHIYQGPYVDEAPDLLIGFRDGYRSSWGSVVGEVEDRVFSDNDRVWSGDHCMDPPATPGVLLSNWRVEDEHCHLQDIAPTILDLFGVKEPQYMDGKALTLSRGEPR